MSDTPPFLVALDRFFCCHRIAILLDGIACLYDDFTKAVRGRPWPEKVRHFSGELGKRGFPLRPSELDALEKLSKDAELLEATGVGCEEGEAKV